jgi:hypothetical protein
MSAVEQCFYDHPVFIEKNKDNGDGAAPSRKITLL